MRGGVSILQAFTNSQYNTIILDKKLLFHKNYAFKLLGFIC